jgi:tetratricopeptide (TPR) repeat protein
VPAFAWGQQSSAGPAAAPAACSLVPQYPLPKDQLALEQLAQRQHAAAGERGCLQSAQFHAWWGATLLALGRPVEAIEPLERALLQDPDLPGAQLDLAQALAAEGDTASARSFLSAMRQRPDLPMPIGSAIDRQLDLLALPSQIAGAVAQGWQSRWQLSALGGADSNLNSGPAASEITLTFPQGSQTLPLASAALPRSGGAAMAGIQWQGLRVRGESLWVLQAELKARQSRESDTNYEQSDAAATWLQAPAAPRQWVVRVASTNLRYGGANLLRATRGTLQYQWETAARGDPGRRWADALSGCRPAASLELEHRRYPSSAGLDGLYEGGALGLLCRRADDARSGGSGDTLTAHTSFYSVQARVGTDHPLDNERPGGSYRRNEFRAQWEGPLPTKGRAGVQWTTTRQADRDPYSALLGNVPRQTLRHVLQVEASWPLFERLSVVANAEISRQTSNLSIFEMRQRSVYVGLRWDVTQ